MPDLVVCTVCGVAKPFSLEFFAKDGERIRRQCRPCRADSKRERRKSSETAERRQARLRAAREYQKANREKIAETQRRWKARNIDAARAYQHARYLENRDAVRERAKAWRLANPQKKAENNRRWASENRETALMSANASKRRRRQKPEVRLSDSMSAQIRAAIQRGKGGYAWEKVVGYSRLELMEHLERQFSGGMTWGNYGSWHVDHIQPLAAFTYSSPDDPEFKACWALTNLRPLWASDNIRKRDKRTLLL